MPSTCWPCGSIVQTVSGIAIGNEFPVINMSRSPHQFESHPSLEFESPNHVIGHALAGQAMLAMLSLPHTQPCPQRVRIAALTSRIDALIDIKVRRRLRRPILVSCPVRLDFDTLVHLRITTVECDIDACWRGFGIHRFCLEHDGIETWRVPTGSDIFRMLCLCRGYCV